jgi:hypothetical protein
MSLLLGHNVLKLNLVEVDDSPKEEESKEVKPEVNAMIGPKIGSKK